MTMEHLAVVIVLLVLVMACVAEWTVEEYPNPQTGASSCRRDHKQSSVCDPDGLISHEGADQLDSVIAGVEHNTRAVCTGLHAFRIRIALVKKLKDTSTSKMTGSDDELLAKKMMRALDLMRSFASKTYKRWNNNGDCDVDVIITYSHEDDVLYTFAGEAVERDFSPFIIDDITHQANVKKENLVEGLSKMICDYGAVFNDTYRPSYTPQKFHPKYQPVKAAMSSSAGRVHTYLTVLLAALFICLFLSRTV